MYSNYYFPVILRPTRITNNSCTLIDNIFFNNPLITNSGLIICDISDHLPIFVSLSFDKIYIICSSYCTLYVNSQTIKSFVI